MSEYRRYRSSGTNTEALASLSSHHCLLLNISSSIILNQALTLLIFRWGSPWLDFDKLHFAETPVSYGEAVKDAVPFEAPDDVVSHRKELKITKAEKDYEKRCVKVGIHLT